VKNQGSNLPVAWVV